jgi:hypothetical protein
MFDPGSVGQALGESGGLAGFCGGHLVLLDVLEGLEVGSNDR